MSTGNQRRGMDATSILSVGLAVLIALPLAPRVMTWTADWTRDELISSFGPELAGYAMIVQALASFVVTGTGLYLTFNLVLRLIQQQIGRAANSLRR
jgi:hypothetical protein